MDMLPEPAVTGLPPGRTYGGNRAFHNYANDYSHISDPNLRRRLALSEIDKVPLGLYHVRAVAVAGVGFFLDSYDIFAISMVTNLWGLVFWGGGDATASALVAETAAAYGYGNNHGSLPDPVNQAVKASTSAGIIVGQLVFGWLADVLGRRRVYGIELAVIVLATLGCALASPSPAMSSTGLLVFWRVVMGVGIGGDYPLSSVITSEFAPTRWRGAMVASVFSMQGFGQLLSAIVALVVTAAFRSEFVGVANAAQCGVGCRAAADRCWRIIIGFGALPACFALYYRITIPETPRYTFDVAHDVEKADADIRAYMAREREGTVDPVVQARLKRVAGPALSSGPSATVPHASWADLRAYFWGRGNLDHLRVLLGTMLSWFFLDLAYYGLALNNSVVLEAIGYSKGANLYAVLYNNAVGTIILACAGSLPGYWTAVLTIDTVGRKPLQVGGFLVLTVLFCVMGFAFHRLSETAMLALYVVAQFFFNWGPNTTTFVIPGECFPTRYRSTAHGISAAMGKIGAILAQVISIPILSRDAPPNCTMSGGSPTSKSCSPWLNRLMQIFALFMLCGTIVSLFCIPETKGVTLEELSGEAPTSYNAGRNGSIGGGGSGGGGGGGARRRRRRRNAAADFDINNNNNNGAGGGATASSSSSLAKAFQEPLDWNPFAGGQPAGFLYPRMGARKYRRRRIFGRVLGGGGVGGRGSSRGGSGARMRGDDYTNDGDDARIDIMTSPELAAQREAARNNKGGSSKKGAGGSAAAAAAANIGHSAPSRSHSGRHLLSRGGASSSNRNHDHDRDSDTSAATLTTYTNANTAGYGGNHDDSGEPGDRPSRRMVHPLHPAFSTGHGGRLPGDDGDIAMGGLAHPPRTAAHQRYPRGTTNSDGFSSDGEGPAHLGHGGIGVFPGWGAGWGRIDRSNIGQATADNTLDDIRLSDVGQLLR
ncbi:MFS transporter, PHS family, inorganic phosphate transporter [Sporothrix schenckii 1099-18]|uniref:Phosphate:H+ symporter n=2 Tax=Sporothrix schenckii TaxID=29908 RepID=U7Q3Y2_SPOS1|nr:MFS transporter, PHS family, inorganic phosphate transporter [Sporothrix schenckii 1099-18]ERT02558.1 phosphate:H+ symporter [Sporothrix schenckii ATCC 58251]KJR80151.1 MFS transporter, PHS family, inorganic phosphate transporter [Sporothrix schenckii 1099-18]